MTPEEIRKVFANADNALAAGRITKSERDYILHHYYGTTNEHDAIRGIEERDSKREHIMTGVITLLVILAAGFLWNGGLTGLIVLDINQNVTNHSIPLDYAVTGLNASGLLHGTGTASIYLDTPNGSLLVGTVTSDLDLPHTDKAGYDPGDEISVINAPDDATYYFDDGNASVPASVPLNATQNGTLLIVTATETYRLPIIIGPAERTVSFAHVCVETCQIPETNGTLRIETTGTAVLEISSIEAAVLNANTAPIQAALLEISINESTSIDLSNYFTDMEDQLYYSTSDSDLVHSSVEGSILTLTPVLAGSGELTIYVSDLQELVPFTIPITVIAPNAGQVEPPANDAVNTTPGNASVPLNETIPNTSLNCTGSNPNLLPEECLLANASEYFPDQDIFWENLDRAKVARFTVIGNLLIAGNIIEHSPGIAGSRDFSIGYVDRDDENVKTIWIDSDGNLHLRGSLHEENANLQPTPGSFSVLTRRSIFLAYADPETGDLYIRGNVIPHRRSIE